MRKTIERFLIETKAVNKENLKKMEDFLEVLDKELDDLETKMMYAQPKDRERIASEAETVNSEYFLISDRISFFKKNGVK